MQLSNLSSVIVISSSALLLSGCFGGSSSSDDNDVATNLSSEEQAALAATSVAALPADMQEAADKAEESADEGGGSSGGSASFQAANVQSLPCDSGSGSIDDDAQFSGSDIPFPEAVDNEIAMEGVSKSTTNCTMSTPESSITMNGDLASLQFGDMDGLDGAAYVAFGGPTGINNFPDRSAPFSISGDINLEQQGYLFICFSCVDDDLSNFTGSGAQDSTLVGHLNLGLAGFEMEMGDSNIPDGTPLVVSTAESSSGTGETELTVNGRHAFSDEACGFDVTFDTQETLFINNWSEQGASTSDINEGRIFVTANDSGDTFDVQWTGGDVTVNGEEIDEDVNTAIQDCT